MTKQNKIYLLLGATAAVVTVALLISKKDKDFTGKIADKGLALVDTITQFIGKGKKQVESLV